MARSFAPSFLVVIKQLYLLLQDIMNTGLSISPSGTYTIASGEHTVMVLCSLVSSIFPKVGFVSAILLLPCSYSSHLANYEGRDDVKFRNFRRQLFHLSLAKMLESLKPGMTAPEVIRFPDGHFRKVIYGLGPYIADYPEQALLTCIVQGWCPKYVFLC